MRLFLILSLLILNWGMNAQTSSSNESSDAPIIIPSLVVGQSMPFGNYATINPYNRENGYTGIGFADPGLAYDFGIMFMAGPSFGVSLTFANFVNPVSEDRLMNYLNARFIYYGPNGPVSYSYQLDVGNWRNNAFLLGIAYKLNQKKVSFDMNLKFGLLSATSPSVRIDTLSDAGAIGTWYSSESERNFGFASSIGFQFRLLVVKALYLNMNSSFLISTYNISHQVYPTNDPTYDPYYYYGSSGGQMNIGTFNLMMGISYEFELK